MSVPAKKPLFLSASRIDTFLNCSQLYHAKYHAHLPDSGNDGSRRGTIVHSVLECLLNPRHRPLYDQIVAAGTCKRTPSVWRMIRWLARKEGVTVVPTGKVRLNLAGDPVREDCENLDLIDSFIMVALRDEFFGPPGTQTIHGEKSFEISVDEGGKRYNLRGFIDKICIVKDKLGFVAHIVDFKSSKQRYTEDKATFNYQSMGYQLAAARHLFPEIGRRQFHFAFLKFKRAPRQEMPTLTDAELSGFEWHLTDLQSSMEGFTEASVSTNLAAMKEDKRWLCGREGVKKDGTPAWICPVRNPMDYWVTIETATGEVIESAHTADELAAAELGDGITIEARHWAGCSAFWSKGRRTSFAA